MGFIGFNFSLLDQVSKAAAAYSLAPYVLLLVLLLCSCGHGRARTVHPVAQYWNPSEYEKRLVVQLSFYGFFHQKHGNQLIHFFFVPSIAWSVAVWFAYTGPLLGIDLPAHLHSLPSVIRE